MFYVSEVVCEIELKLSGQTKRPKILLEECEWNDANETMRTVCQQISIGEL